MTSTSRNATAPPDQDRPIQPGFSPIPFTRLLRVEWSKVADTRSARWLIGILALATAAIELVPLLALGPDDQTYSTYLGLPVLVLSTVLPAVAILAVTTEWTQRTVLATFTQEPRRGRVVSAKVVVSVLIGLAGAAFGALVAILAAGIATVAGRHPAHDLDPGQFVGYPLFIVVVMLSAVAFAVLVHNTAATIVTYFVLPIAIAIVADYVHAVSQWLDNSTTFDWLMNSEWSAHVAQILTSIGIWVVIPIALGTARTIRREVT